MKTTIELDQNLLRQAQKALGTDTIKGTVEASLRTVIQRGQLQQLADALGTIPLDLTPGNPSSLPSESTDPQPLPDEQIARWEGIGLVRLSLLTLDERSRELIRLKFIEEMSYKRISEHTGLTVSHVGYLLHHAIKAVADELAKTGVVP